MRTLCGHQHLEPSGIHRRRTLVGAGTVAASLTAALAFAPAASAATSAKFNLGHGVLPDTDPGDLKRIVELVHERTAA